MKIPVIVDLEPKEEAYLPLLLLSSDPAYEIRAITFSRQPESPEDAKALSGLISRLGVEVPVAFGDNPSAVRLMSDIISGGDSPAILVWGPLSNIAPLLLTQPELREHIRCVSFAGGSFRGGDATAAAERNVYADPEALDIVLRSKIRFFMAPLELDRALTALKLPREIPGNRGQVLRNLCAALVCAEPGLFQTRELYVETELSGEFSRGSTVADFKGQLEREPNASVLEAFDAGRLSTALSALLDACGQEVKG